jgi:hypothetical protein
LTLAICKWPLTATCKTVLLAMYGDDLNRIAARG